MQACGAVAGHADNHSDCDDSDAASDPGASELCDGVDNDCDGQLSSAETDDDGDGVSECAGDCNDTDGGNFPGNVEVCDGADNNCDSVIDEGVLVTWYADSDGDGYGELGSSLQACNLPPGYTANSGDCDDGTATTNPGSFEVCDGVDNDCDGNTDDASALNSSTWYIDADGDSYGSIATQQESCDQPAGYVLNAQDCDDALVGINPGETELCDGVDNDCDGTTDVGAANQVQYFEDADNDGQGDALGVATSACTPPTGFVTNSDDCNDLEATIYQGAPEICDGLDNDCDTSIDDGVLGIGPQCAAAACLEIKQASPTAADGSYWIDPDGDTTAVEVYCDMGTDGGGWTMAGYSYVGATNTSSSNHNFRSLKCGGGSYNPTNRGQSSAAIPSVELAQASTEIAFSMTTGSSVSTGAMDAYGLAWKFAIPDPSAVHFNNHSYLGPGFNTSVSGAGPCVAVTVQGIVGDSFVGTKYTLRHVLGTTWTDTYPSGYGVANTTTCYNHVGGPFVTSIHTGESNYNIGSTVSECDISDGSLTYTHLGNYHATSTGQTGSAAIWLR